MSGREAICAWNTSSFSFILPSSADWAQGIEINEIQHSLWHVHFIFKVKKTFFKHENDFFFSAIGGKYKCPKGVCVQKGWGYVDPVSPVQPGRVESQGTVSRRQRPRQSFIPSAALHFRHCDFQTIPGHTPCSLIFFFQYSKHSSARIHVSSCSSFLWFLPVQAFFLIHAFLCLF